MLFMQITSYFNFDNNGTRYKSSDILTAVIFSLENEMNVKNERTMSMQWTENLLRDIQKHFGKNILRMYCSYILSQKI